jgi:hypothetical protein
MDAQTQEEAGESNVHPDRLVNENPLSGPFYTGKFKIEVDFDKSSFIIFLGFSSFFLSQHTLSQVLYLLIFYIFQTPCRTNSIDIWVNSSVIWLFLQPSIILFI